MLYFIWKCVAEHNQTCKRCIRMTSREQLHWTLFSLMNNTTLWLYNCVSKANDISVLHVAGVTAAAHTL
jgi:hypothetical protein